MNIGIIIPCYNEEKEINKEVFVQFIIMKENCHVCFVNDGSTDNTLEILNEIKKQIPHKVSVIDIKVNKGKLGAIKAGARYLFTKEDIDYIGYMNAKTFSKFNNYNDDIETLNSLNDSIVLFKTITNSIKRGGINELYLNLSRRVCSRLIEILISNQLPRFMLFKKSTASYICNLNYPL
ncbi:glycosyltransferase [Tenacibaculum sp. IB213877]|uniref:glycosyltransferase n=1 Tax=Tenacibaculum sp. IB213877 TaxID=3097351 RepID=UPI002A5997E6|nr:glycosyltransferase [Tenacibaculum sp. IB213877]MDY0781499.1 glycosyltransferase [Tenacibaculum sp. IB213877]